MSKQKSVNKYRYRHVVQSNWGKWEDERSFSDDLTANEWIRLMRKSNPFVKYRLITRRVANPAYRGRGY